MALPQPVPQVEADLAALHEASFGWAKACCSGDSDQAAEVLQNVYVKVLSGVARFHRHSSFKTWLFGVIRLTALEQWRREARERPLSLEGRDYVSSATPADNALIEAERATALQRALAQLPARQKEVLHLVFYQDMTIAEAAGAMDVSIGSARTHYERGKKRLRAILALSRDHQAGILPVSRSRTSDDGGHS